MLDGDTEHRDGQHLLWVAAPAVGETSEAWMLRQMCGMRRLRVSVLAWDDMRRDDEAKQLRVHRMQPPRPARTAETGFARWWARLVRLGSRNFLEAASEEVLALERLYATENPSIILAHYGHTGLRMLAVARSLRIPLIVHFHGVDLSGALRNRWYRWSLLTHMHRFDAMIAVGSQQRDWLLEQGADPAKVHLIPCGAPIRTFARNRPLTFNPVRFISVSRLAAQKGVDVNLRAFARVADALPEARMTIVGDGPERTALETLAAKLGLRDRVRFTGNLPPEGVRAALEDASIFLQHSLDHEGWYEGFGVSLTEAMAMGLPAIVSACGGLLDQVTDGRTGIVCPQRDVEDVAAAMLRLATDEALAGKLGAAGRMSALENFDTERQVARLELVLRGLST
jgi:glycosyltransferase involved in cell wall biosynthesis